ncbi:MAG: hypothetical protein JSU86_01010, partial [Phycisphaerales bacterium]
SFALPTDFPEGTWFIGATIRTIGGISPTVTFYATGRVVIVREPTLTVTKPDSSAPISPSTPVAIAWTTNAPPSSGTVDVFARTVASSGAPYGPEIAIETDAPMQRRTATFISDASGLFEITVRLEFIDDTTKSATAPVRVRVSSIPPILWLGSLADPQPPFEGAIFGGANYEDNAGTTLTTAGDLDGDEMDEFVVGARYGKPGFVNPSGVGPGEAYIINGGTGRDKLLGEYNLNSVGKEEGLLRGVTATGIRTLGDTDDTDGLSDITLIPDADADGRGELVFGFPRTNSRDERTGAPVGPLCAAGQFLNGGVVILSSSNSILADPNSETAVINLEEVGQTFTDMSVPLATPDLVLADRREFEPSEDPPACVDGTDGIDDTIIGPCEGFNPILAPPAYEQLGFEWVYSPPAPAPGLCETQFDLSACPPGTGPLGGFAGSGFYPSDTIPLEPLGVRIIGPSEGDRFGTSVTYSNPLGDESPGDLIISAPKRTAFAAFVDGTAVDIQGAGVAFLMNNGFLPGADNLLPDGSIPPAPYQCVAGFT